MCLCNIVPHRTQPRQPGILGQNLPRMKPLLRTLLTLLIALHTLSALAADPLRVFIRAGAKTHGPNQHDHPRFLKEWSLLLGSRGMKVDGALDFPSADQLAKTDVLVMYCANGGMLSDDQAAQIHHFKKRGGGIVVIHDAVCGSKADSFKALVGGAWQHGRAKWLEGDISLYMTDREHPITRGVSNFDLHDEIYYQLDFDPAARVLASSWTPDSRGEPNNRAVPSVYDTCPQLWTHESPAEDAPFKDKTARSFVSIPGHNWSTFELPHFRAILLRGIAWTGHRENTDEFVSKEELASLTYPERGPTAPDKAAATLNVHPDFTATLVAAEPLINKVITVDWDANGRLWVAETPEYPNGLRGMRDDYQGREWRDVGGIDPTPGKQERKPADRVSWLESSKQDGVYDRKHVFADGIELITGFVLHQDGVIVTAAPHILLLRDTDGDGQADSRQVLYTGLGIGDTHAVINNPRWGVDGWIYATHGYSGSGNVTSGDGSRAFGSIGAGVVRFRPDGSAIEQVSSRGGNTWGLTLTANNEIIWSKPTNGTICLHTLLSESQLNKAALGKSGANIVIASPKTFPQMSWTQKAYRQIDWVGSFTAAAGAAVYDGGAWPAKWDNSYFITEPTINIVHHSFLTPDGLSYTAAKEPGREETEFITSKDLWFRPIEVRVGPDGALYVVDFYNQAAVHNDTRGPDHNRVNAAVRPDRDHHFARIWRIMHREGKSHAVPQLAKTDDTALANALTHPAQHVRMNALRLLVERKANHPAIANLLADQTKPGHQRVQALWTLHRTNHLSPEQLATAVASTDNTLSSNAIRIASEKTDSARLANSLLDRVRSGNARNQIDALLGIASLDPLPDPVVETVITLFPSLDNPFAQSAASAVAMRNPVRSTLTALAAKQADALRPLLEAVVTKASADPVTASALLVALADAPPSPARTRAISAIANSVLAAPKPAWTDTTKSALSKLLASPDSASAASIANAWDASGSLRAEVDAIATRLRETLANPSSPAADRSRAIRELAAIRPDKARETAASLLANATPDEVKRAAIEGLFATRDKFAAEPMFASAGKLSAPLKSLILNESVNRPEWTDSLLDAMEKALVSTEDLGPILIDRLRNHPNKPLAKRAGIILEKLKSPAAVAREKLIADLTPRVLEGGDPAKGKLTFQSACAVCHKLNGEGAAVAPELTGMGAHPRGELLVHIVDPNREVDPSFAAWQIETKDGATLVGIVTRENTETVTLRDPAAEREIRKENINKRTATQRSLMPEGFEALGADGLKDLLAYLESASPSDFKSLDLSKAATVDGRLGLFASEKALTDSLEFVKYGSVKVGKVPFYVINPAGRSDGRNLIVLKGGSGQAAKQPQTVEIPVQKVSAKAVHILGGVGGWAFPWIKDREASLSLTVHYQGGDSEVIALVNGEEIADYNGRHDVKGSVHAQGLVKAHQIRTVTKPLTKTGVIERITLSSAGGAIAPLVAAITLETR